MSDIYEIEEVNFEENGEKIQGLDLTIDVYDISITLPIDTRRINLKELKKLMKNFDEEN
mgnify:CR=1 FL=1|jgi:hypothetical protein|uniref:Uncharacterized protein n=1 Tax=Myoviridae sp. ctWb16 TaxID=2827690 RepID=A0A8S5T123_9CAUD|nr:MAG TPA: hypothetical protein [Myoviridae sp. ctWb16]